MPLIRLKDIRGMDSDARLDRIGEFNTELLRLKTMVGAGGTVENPARIKELRRAIARILTIEREDKLGIRAKQEKPKEKKKEKAKEKKAAKNKSKLAEKTEEGEENVKKPKRRKSKE
jgi:large subunit ribosomal protein L29